MDETIETVLSEIALEGEVGCNLTRFYFLLDQRMMNTDIKGIRFPLDNYMKEFIFENLKYLKDISIRQPDGLAALEFGEERFQKETYLIASKTLRTQELDLDSVSITWTDQVKRIFEKVISARENGVNQAILAKDENLDPRSCFHYIKILVQAKLCVKIPILCPIVPNGPNVSTNLIIHQKFKNTSPAYISFMKKNQQLDRIDTTESLVISTAEASILDTDFPESKMSTRIEKSLIIEKMKLLLEKGKDNTLRLNDMMTALMETTSKSRKGLSAIVAALKKSGHLKAFDIPNPSSKSNGKRNGYISCIQMIKPLPTSKDEVEDGGEDAADVEEHPFVLKQDLPLETQVYNLILESGSTGIGSLKLMTYLSPYLSYKSVTKILNTIQGNSSKSKSSGNSYIKSVHDFDGKMRCSRYFATNLVKKSLPPPKKGNAPPSTASTSQQQPAASGGLECAHCKKPIDLNLPCSSESYQPGQFCSKGCETSFLVGSESKAVSTSTHGLAGVSMNSIRRSMYLENILNRVRIVEFGSRLVSLIVDEAKAYGESETYLADNKTVQRIVDRLLEEKKANVLEVRAAVLGRVRRYLVHPSIRSIHDEEFKEYIKAGLEKQYKVNREIQEIEVDAMVFVKDDVQDEEALPVLDLNLNVVDMPGPPAAPLPPQGAAEVSVDDSHWLEIASKFGYVEERYKKAKLLHLWLFDFSGANSQIISSSDLFDYFPLRLYMSLVGVRKHDETLEKMMLQQPGVFDAYTLSSVPSEFKYLTSMYNLRRVLSILMDVLESFVFVECLEVVDGKYSKVASSESSLAPFYRVRRKVPEYIDLFEYTVSRTHINFASHSDILKYWKNLHEEVKKIKMGRKRLVHARFKGIVYRRNWVTSGLSTNQRQGLLTHADSVNGTTPMRNANFCRSLAQRFDISLDDIQDFYSTFEARHKRSKEKNSTLKSVASKKGKKETDTVSPKSNEPSEKVVPPVTLPDTATKGKATKKSLKGKEPVVEESDLPPPPPGPNGKGKELHEHPVKADTEKKPLTRRKTNVWSMAEDDLFCFGYVVMMRNQRGRGISAALSRKLVPTRMDLHADAPRRRIKQLKEMEENIHKFELIESKWDLFYERIQKEKSWFADALKDNLDTVFLVVVEEFIAFVQSGQFEVPTQEPVAAAAPVVQAVEDDFEKAMNPTILGREYTVSDNSIPIDEGLEARTSRAAKLSFLNAMSFSIPLNESLADFDYFPVEANDIRSDLAVSLLKLIIMIADDSYNAEDAYTTLSENFTAQDISHALDRLRTTATIASKLPKSQAVADRRPPNRSAQISDRALALLNGSLDFVSDAKEHWKRFSDPSFQSEVISENRSSGMMATLTDIFSASDYTLEASELVKVEKEGNNANSIDVKLKRGLKAAGRVGQKKRKETEDNHQEETTAKNRKRLGKMAAKDPVTDFKSIISLISKQNNIQESFLLEIYNSIAGGGIVGKSLMDIYDDMSDVWTRSHLEVMISLLLVGKVIVAVGTSHPRYVTAQYEVDWMIYVKKGDGSFIKPEFWTELDGTVNLQLHQKCLECVFGFILQKPGITEKNLLRRVSSLFSAMELRTLLDELCSKGIINKVTSPAPPRITGLLSGLFRKADGDDVDVLEEVVTSYFPARSWFQIL